MGIICSTGGGSGGEICSRCSSEGAVLFGFEMGQIKLERNWGNPEGPKTKEKIEIGDIDQ
jgi:hypothetical protein